MNLTYLTDNSSGSDWCSGSEDEREDDAFVSKMQTKLRNANQSSTNSFCILCNTTKPSTFFSKTQLKKPNSRKCKECAKPTQPPPKQHQQRHTKQNKQVLSDAVSPPLTGKNKEMFDKIQVIVARVENTRTRTLLQIPTTSVSVSGLDGSGVGTESHVSVGNAMVTTPPIDVSDVLDEISSIIDACVSEGACVAKVPLLHLCGALMLPVEFIDLILSKGADINFVDEEGLTALIVAAGAVRDNKCECMEALVSAGASKVITACGGLSAWGIYYKGRKLNQSQSLQQLDAKNERKIVDDLMDTKIGDLLAVEGVVPNKEDLQMQEGVGGEEARALSVLETLFTQNGMSSGTAVQLLESENDLTALQALERMIPDEAMRSQMLLMHESLGTLMSGSGMGGMDDEDEDEDC